MAVTSDEALSAAGLLIRPAAATMRAAVFNGPGQIEVQTVTLPEPGPREVRIRLEGCGVCASNLPVWQGREWFDYPLAPGAPGHEGWGRIDAVGDEVRDLQVGDRVTGLSYRAYAEYDIAAADAVVRLPVELLNMPFPGEPLACAMNIFMRSDIQAGQTVAIVGCGFLGVLLCALATNAGAQVLALSRRPCAMEMARLYGATASIATDDRWQAQRRVQELTNGRGCDRVIEAAGLQSTLDLAADLVAVRGRLVIAGYHQDGRRSIDLQSWNWRGIDVINAHERDPRVYLAGMRAAVAMVTAGELDPAPLYTHRFGLDELPFAFETLARRPDGFVKALLLL